jgi:hypothetical protein
MSVGCLVHWVRQVIHLSSGLSFSVIVHLLSRTDNLRLRRNADGVGYDFCLTRQQGSVNSIFKKHLFTHFRNVSAVLGAILFRTSALHRLDRRRLQQVLALYTRLLYPASLKLSVLVRICGGTVGTGRCTVTSQLLHPPVCVIIAYTGYCGVVGTRRSFRGQAVALTTEVRPRRAFLFAHCPHPP